MIFVSVFESSRTKNLISVLHSPKLFMDLSLKIGIPQNMLHQTRMFLDSHITPVHFRAHLQTLTRSSLKYQNIR